MAGHHNPIKKETNLLTLFKICPGHYIVVTMGYSVNVFFSRYNFQYLYPNPPIFPKVPTNYYSKHFILIHQYLSSFPFVCI